MKGQAHVDHIGLFVKDVAKTVECLKLLPNAEGFEPMPEFRFQKPILKVGEDHTLKGAEGSVCGLRLEVLEAVPEVSRGCYMFSRMDEYGEGLHHIDVDFTDREDFQEYLDKLLAHGGVIKHHGAGETVWEGIYSEGVYVEMPAGGLCFALGYAAEMKK